MSERTPVRAVRAVAVSTLLAGVGAVLTAFTLAAGGDARASVTTPPPTVSATLTTGSGASR